MSAPIPAPEPQGPVTPPAVETKPAEAPAQETDWKAEARKWEQRAKENSTAAARLAEIEEASKTEAQKLAERAEKAEKALAERDAKEALAATRAEVAKAAGVPESALRGGTREELEAHAAELKPLIAPPAPDVPKGAIGPYVPPEGTGTVGDLGGAAQAFADFLAPQLGH